MKSFYVIALLLVALCGEAAERADVPEWSVVNISDSLAQDALAVVRQTSTVFEYQSEKSGVERKSRTLTVLDKQGEYMADVVLYGDKFRTLKRFSAKLYDAAGRLLRKFGKSEMQEVLLNDALASDSRYYYFHCEAPVLPFTIEYEYEMEWRNGIFSFPIFSPQQRYGQALEQGCYVLDVPEDLPLRIKALNGMPRYEVMVQGKGRKRYVWQLEGLKPVVEEKFAPPMGELLPVLYVGPESFVYDHVRGTITDWDTYGKWIYGLFEGRGQLPETVKAEIANMTAHAKSAREKVSILYDYLAETTRYVSIQLGIGGFQPMPAAEVNKTGFGDCKALSFYLKALLETVGIPSNYVEVYSDERHKSLMPDYATFYETNHVILQVPLDGDTLWLECTNPRLPFGFIHNNIAGHDAVEIKKGGGRLCTLPDYPDSLSVDENKADVRLLADGSAKVKAGREYRVKRYGDLWGFGVLKRSEQIDFLRRGIGLPNAEISSLSMREDKSAYPALFLDYEWSTSLYGSKTGNRLFLPVNPYRQPYDWFKKEERLYDVDIWRGFYLQDSLHICLPEGYEVEALPQSVSLDGKYGRFLSAVSLCKDGIWITQQFLLRTGRYAVAEYRDIQKFFEQINAAYAGRIVLKKEE